MAGLPGLAARGVGPGRAGRAGIERGAAARGAVRRRSAGVGPVAAVVGDEAVRRLEDAARDVRPAEAAAARGVALAGLAGAAVGVRVAVAAGAAGVDPRGAAVAASTAARDGAVVEEERRRKWIEDTAEAAAQARGAVRALRGLRFGLCAGALAGRRADALERQRRAVDRADGVRRAAAAVAVGAGRIGALD